MIRIEPESLLALDERGPMLAFQTKRLSPLKMPIRLAQIFLPDAAEPRRVVLPPLSWRLISSLSRLCRRLCRRSRSAPVARCGRGGFAIWTRRRRQNLRAGLRRRRPRCA